MGHIESIEINSFRGIKQLEITGFSNINLIVGDNNSGKTTFLEAIQLLFAKTQIGSVKKIINQRSVLILRCNSSLIKV
ncbi:AAA domain-containing protein [Butyrivibrio hungatei DSM 14810]|uniref:AAA domain-containing protein n=1 Tax=Butyrivibrio hungatei DSM 14810 TaxID=1121132 RepID=A0A1M7RXW5_9FIRM|nr:AAA family ATPase [Butyrivibrio hungatei]SHN51020.1 AAA domain-containing protein [Butyrivibrio hungatei DSM 14810]